MKVKVALFFLIWSNSINCFAQGDTVTLLQILSATGKILNNSNLDLAIKKKDILPIAPSLLDAANTMNIGSQESHKKADLIRQIIQSTNSNDRFQSSINLALTNEDKILGLETHSIKNSGDALFKISRINKRSSGNLQALQILTQAAINNTNETNALRASINQNKRIELSKEKLKERERIKIRSNSRAFYDVENPRPKNQYKSY